MTASNQDLFNDVVLNGDEIDDGQFHNSLACPGSGGGGAGEDRRLYTFEDLASIEPRALFIRGDLVWDEELLLTDGLLILKNLFIDGKSFACEDAADVNDDGEIDVSDPISLFTYLYLGGVQLPEPVLSPGPDPTRDSLECE